MTTRLCSGRAANDSDSFLDTSPTTPGGWSISFLRQRMRQRELARRWRDRLFAAACGAALAFTLAYCGGPA